MWFIVSYFSRLFVLLFCVDSVYHVLLKERVICAIMIEKERNMLAYVYKDKGNFALEEKPRPVITDPKDAIVKITLASICTSDLHIKHGFVPRAVKGVTVGHEAVGIVEEVGGEIHNVKAGDRVVVNVETFCGECFFCKRGYVNNCTDKNGGWAIGCRIDGVQAQYVKVPFANTGLTKIPDNVSDEEALFVGDILATGYIRDGRRRRCPYNRRRTHGNMHRAVRRAEESFKADNMREGRKEERVCKAYLSYG